MSDSPRSREIIANSVEIVMCAQWYDANISIPVFNPGCDKNIPGERSVEPATRSRDSASDFWLSIHTKYIALNIPDKTC